MNAYSKYLEKLYRPSLEPDDRKGGGIYLDRNEPAFPAFQNIQEVFEELDFGAILRTYPNPYRIYESISDYYRSDLDSLLLTHGSEQGIRFIFDTFVDVGAQVVLPYPSFGLYEVFAYLRQAKIQRLDFDNRRVIEVSEIVESVKKDTQLLVVANPNSPTGSAYSFQDIVALCDHALNTDTLMLLDEAYYHFYSLDTLALLSDYSNLVISRSFSKAWGLAGIRAGMLFSSPKNIKLLRSQKLSMELNQLSLAILNKAAPNADQIISRNVDQVAKWKKKLATQNSEHYQYHKSHGNFALLRLNDFTETVTRLGKRGIYVRHDFKHESMEDIIRVSIASDHAMQEMIQALEQND